MDYVAPLPLARALQNEKTTQRETAVYVLEQALILFQPGMDKLQANGGDQAPLVRLEP